MRQALMWLTVAVLAAGVVGCASPSHALHFSDDPRPAAVANDPSSATIQVTNTDTPVGGASISKGQLPDGLTIDVGGAAQGAVNALIVRGTPTTPGSYTF